MSTQETVPWVLEYVKTKTPRAMEERVRETKHSEFVEGLFTSEMINMYVLWTMITFFARHILWFYVII